MISLRLAAALLIALVPGVVSLLLGRRLIGLKDDPAFHQEYSSRTFKVYGLVFLAMVIGGAFGTDLWPWYPLLLLLVTAAASFPIRRQLFGEDWGFFAYMSATVRWAIAMMGGWILLLLIPTAMQGAGDLMWPLGGFLALVLVVFNEFHATILLAIVRARPASFPEIQDRLNAIVSRSSLESVELYRAGPTSRRWAVAVAVGDPRRKAIVLTEAVIAGLEPDEFVAILAEKVASLERMDQAFFRQARSWDLLGLTVAVLLVPAAEYLSSGASQWATLVWYPVLGFALFTSLFKHRMTEAKSLARAVELFEDPAALERAVVKTGLTISLPNPASLDLEKAASDPKVATQIRAIREAAGRPLPVVEDGTLPAVFQDSEHPSQFTLFDEEGIHWLSGVPSGPVEVEELRRVAGSIHSQPYKEIKKLHIKYMARGGPRLVAVDQSGERRELSFPKERTPEIERIVVGVGPFELPAPTAEKKHWIRPYAAMLLVLSMLPGIVPMVLALPSLLALIRTAPAPMFAASAMLVATAPATVLAGDLDSLPPHRFWLVMGLFVGLGIIAFRNARKRHRVADDAGQRQLVAVTAAALALVGLVGWARLALAGAASTYLLHRTVLESTGLVLLAPVGVAAALLSHPGRAARISGLVVLLLAVVPAILGTKTYSTSFASDPLLTRQPAVAADEASLRATAVVPIDSEGYDLRLSPGGSSFGVRVFTKPTDFGGMASTGFTIGRFSDSSTKQIDVDELAFLDEDRFLTLERDWKNRATVLRARTVDSPEEASWESTLPDLYMPEISGDGSGAWTVTAHTNEPPEIVRITGTVGREEKDVARWATGGLEAFGRGVGVGPNAVVVDAPLSDIVLPRLGIITTVLPASSDVWLIGPERRRLTTTGLYVSCLDGDSPDESVTCIASGSDYTSIWSVGLETGELEAKAVFDRRLARTGRGAAGRITMLGPCCKDRVTIYEEASRSALDVVLLDAEGYIRDVALGSDTLGVLSGLDGAGNMKIRLYSLKGELLQ